MKYEQHCITNSCHCTLENYEFCFRLIHQYCYSSTRNPISKTSTLQHQRSNTGTSNSSNSSRSSSSSSSINLSSLSESNIQVPIVRAFKWKDEDAKYSFEYFELFRKSHRVSSTDTLMSEEKVSGLTSTSSLKSLDGFSKEEYMDESEKIEDVLRLEGACVYAVRGVRVREF